METFQRNFNHIGSPPSPSSDTSSPVLVIAILGIIITGFLLLSYYIFVIKCWLNWHRIDVLRRFSLSQTIRYEDPLMVYAPGNENRGVDESVIRAIPIFQFKKIREGSVDGGNERDFFECAVCLNEFQEQEKLRVLPSCGHVFHIDCIDIWLQNNANCPLCRSSISTVTRFPLDRILAPTSSPQDQTPLTQDALISGDEDFVVIEVMGNNGVDQNQSSNRRREKAKSGDVLVQSISPSSSKLDQKLIYKKGKKFHHVSSMGDECIDTRGKDDQFLIQPIRRSISMDSSNDRQLYLVVQEIIQQNRHHNEVSTSEGTSTSNSRVRRSFFSFGSGRGSRIAVLPIQFES
ncbi:hypothetical protein GIB67_039569 [Kingdonia uniflora]|uniref:RING-type E3 ubiquitin transferase n=1 Tax=Kingdonia uniflora TaxID=39325 RepID=A0A7J7P6G6_9MAGN|nr:hypothetical protein GIB67_039569 [Kingdonia uniflora]